MNMAKHHIYTTAVKWNLPRISFAKLNLDGCPKNKGLLGMVGLFGMIKAE